MRFAYTVYPADPSPVDPSDESSRPALRVRVTGSNPARQELIWGILDTGSEQCVLPYEFAERMSPIRVGNPGILVGFTGAPQVVEYGTVWLQIRLAKQVIRWPAVVAFTRGRDEALWGMAGFLEHFQVTFDGPGKHFTIRLRGEPPPGFAVATMERQGRRRRSKATPIEPHEQDP